MRAQCRDRASVLVAAPPPGEFDSLRYLIGRRVLNAPLGCVRPMRAFARSGATRTDCPHWTLPPPVPTPRCFTRLSLDTMAAWPFTCFASDAKTAVFRRPPPPAGRTIFRHARVGLCTRYYMSIRRLCTQRWNAEALGKAQPSPPGGQCVWSAGVPRSRAGSTLGRYGSLSDL